jgi:hypothetical protein
VYIRLVTMLLPLTLLLALLVQSAVSRTPAKRYYSTHNYYVLEHDPRSGESLVDVALALGVEVVEQAGELKNHWLLRAEKPVSHLAQRHPTDHVLDSLETFRLRARSLSHSSRSTETERARRIVSSIKYFSPQSLRQRVKRAPPPVRPSDDGNSSAAARVAAQRLGINDPMFPQQWHLINDDFPRHMMNPTPVWEMGVTGKGVISAMVDDGLDYGSEDLAENFVCLFQFCCKYVPCSRKPSTQPVPTTSMTTWTCRHQCSLMITMVLVVLVRLPQSRTTSVVLVLPTSPRSQVFVFFLDAFRMSMKPRH